MTRVLILDDDADVLKAARLALAGDCEAVVLISSPEQLEATLEAQSFDAVLVDMNFVLGDHSGAQGLDVLARIQTADPALAVVLMTAYGGVSLAVEALKRGAHDFVLKPWRNEKLTAAAAAAAAQTRARRQAAESLNLDDVERRAIEQAMARFEGNVSQAAAALGLTRPALYRRLVKHGL